MTRPALLAEGIGKQYQIGLRERGYRTMREAVARLAAAPLRRFKRLAGRVPDAETFWALRDVSFEVQPGAVVGIIGRNGAGKSTLLKILSRITEPTTGRAEIRGRVSSLLEVGTGFHPELTGRENVFLNGSILGMTNAEIKRKFDQIVEFSGVQRFIDTPVKRYSSGMQVRLAFAVAAHLEPEILLVDEVLAVGDAEFQKKCLGKMEDVAAESRTVLFVSHNMDAVKRICAKAIWLDDGRIRFQGEVNQCIWRYLYAGFREGGRVEMDPPLRLANGMPVALLAVQVADGNGRVKQHFSAREPISVKIEWMLAERIYKPRIGFILQASDGPEVLTALDAQSWTNQWLEPGRYTSLCSIPGQLLNEGSYILTFSGDAPPRLSGSTSRGYDFKRGLTGALLRFEIEDDMTLPNKHYGQEGFRDARWPGMLLANIPWTQHRSALPWNSAIP